MLNFTRQTYINHHNGQVKRPPNAFVLFSKHMRQPILKECLVTLQDNKHKLAKVIGVMWQSMTISQKKPFQDTANLLDLQHRKLFPHFVNKQRHVIPNSKPSQSNAVSEAIEEADENGEIRKSKRDEKSSNPIAIAPLPGPVSPAEVPSPVIPPWCDRGRRPNPNQPIKPSQKLKPKSEEKKENKITITDPTKVRFRIVPKYRHCKYICSKRKERELTHKRENGQKSEEHNKKQIPVPLKQVDNQIDGEEASWCSLDNISSPHLFDEVADVETALLQMNSTSLNTDKLPMMHSKNVNDGRNCLSTSDWTSMFSPTCNLSTLFGQTNEENGCNLSEKDLLDTSSQQSNDSESPMWIRNINSIRDKSSGSRLPLLCGKDTCDNSNWREEFNFLCSPMARTSIAVLSPQPPTLPEDPLTGIGLSLNNSQLSTPVLPIAIGTSEDRTGGNDHGEEPINSCVDEQLPCFSSWSDPPEDDHHEGAPINSCGAMQLQCSPSWSANPKLSTQPNAAIDHTEIEMVLLENPLPEADGEQSSALACVGPLENCTQAADIVTVSNSIQTTTFHMCESMGKVTTSDCMTCTTGMCMSGCGGSECSSQIKRQMINLSKSTNADICEPSVCVSTPLLPPLSSDCKMSPATTQLVDNCLEKNVSPFVSPFLANMATMPSPLASDHSGYYGDVSISDGNYYPLTPQRTPKRTVTSIRTSALHPIAKLAFSTKPARRSLNLTSFSPQQCFEGQQSPEYLGQVSPVWKHCTPKRMQETSPQSTECTPTKRRRLPSVTLDHVQMMVLGFETNGNDRVSALEDMSPAEEHNHNNAYTKETTDAVEALLNVQFE